MMNRENGYYWVKKYGVWLIAKWHKGDNKSKWYVIRHNYEFDDKYWEEIDENRIERD